MTGDSSREGAVPSTGELTQLLRRWHDGDHAAADRLFPLVYQELRRLARRHLFSERVDHTLPPTGLVHEAYLKMMGGQIDARDRLHFYTLAATVMRQVLIDHAKRRLRQKRGGKDIQVSLEDVSVSIEQDSKAIVDLDEALTRLQDIDPRVARVVELHYFGGLDYDETAEAVGSSRSTVNRDLRFAKAWLKKAFGSALYPADVNRMRRDCRIHNQTWTASTAQAAVTVVMGCESWVVGCGLFGVGYWF